MPNGKIQRNPPPGIKLFLNFLQAWVGSGKLAVLARFSLVYFAVVIIVRSVSQ